MDENPARKITAAFGGPTRLAIALSEIGYPITSSAVCHWSRPRASGGSGGLIPARWARPILIAAERMHIEISPADFIQ